jgi:hypothetical protein
MSTTQSGTGKGSNGAICSPMTLMSCTGLRRGSASTDRHIKDRRRRERPIMISLRLSGRGQSRLVRGLAAAKTSSTWFDCCAQQHITALHDE